MVLTHILANVCKSLLGMTLGTELKLKFPPFPVNLLLLHDFLKAFNIWLSVLDSQHKM